MLYYRIENVCICTNDIFKSFQESQRGGESSFAFKRKRLQTMDYSDLAMGVQNRPIPSLPPVISVKNRLKECWCVSSCVIMKANKEMSDAVEVLGSTREIEVQDFY